MAEDKPTEWLTVEEFRRQSRLGRNTVYNAIRANHIPHVRVGRRILIPADSLERLMKEANANPD
jgi:excisionase family DNA binding protein